MMNYTDKWAGIESEELDQNNWVQVGFRWDKNSAGHPYREYLVFGKIKGEDFREMFQFDEAKELAYDRFWAVLEGFEKD
jgi:hypothetical protein